MKVLVKEKAFYAGRRVYPGTVLTVPDQTKGSWFEVIEEPKKPVKKQESA
jgi:hypothetical protein